MQNLRPPKLDDRSFDDLRRELVRRIPVHAPKWTDHNPGDPGIAVLEVFAWLAENLLYRMNRVPEKAELHFLNLLDIPLRPAQPSRALVRVELDLAGNAAPEPQLLPAGPTAERTLVTAGKLEFQVLGEIEILPVEALVAIKARLPKEAEEKAIGLAEVKEAIRDNLGKDDDKDGIDLDAVTYTTRVLAPPQDGALPAPTEFAAAVDRSLWIALLVPSEIAGAYDPTAIRKYIAGRVLSIGVLLDATLCGPDDVQRCPDAGAPETALPLVWQIATGRLTGSEPRLDAVRYERLAVEEDGTAGLMQSGVLRVRLPQDAEAFGTWTNVDGVLQGAPDTPPLDQALEGAGDLPPLLDDEALSQRVVTWIRCFRPAPVQSVPVDVDRTSGATDSNAATDATADLPQPVVRWVDINLVEVEQAVTAAPEILGNGTGRPGQTVQLTRAPVVAGSVFLEVLESVGAIQWTEVDSLVASSPADPHYVLDAASGEIRFGDGIRGRMPRPGETIRARSYRYGGGVAGNVPAKAISRVRQPRNVGKLRATNLLPASGGVDGETVEQAKARIPLVLRHNDRAVAAEDFRVLAMETPGANLGRAEVLPRHKPQERVDGVPGVVTLIVLPAYDPLHPDEPVPDRNTLRKVCAYLEPRRLVTTELYVTAPEYVPVWISVAFEVEEGYGKQTVRRWVELGIRQYLAPLPPYGPGGRGWPLGRTVSAPDVEAAVLRVEGVRLVHAVIVEGQVSAGKPPVIVKEQVSAGKPPSAAHGPVTLQSWQLPVVRSVQLNTETTTAEPISRDGDAARPGTEGGGGGGGGGIPMPVPVIEEVC